MALLELNLDHTGLSLGITTKQNALVPVGKYQGESLVSAGKHFQQHRYNLQPAYIVNCIHDTSGLQSVSFQNQDTQVMGGTCNIGYIPCCEECNVTPFLHNGISFVHRDKGFLFTEHNELYMMGCDLQMTFVELRGLDPDCLEDVVDIVSVQGKRIVIMTKDEIYYSSLMDGTGKTGNWTTDDVTAKPYIDFYNLGGATGKFSISGNIGHNKRTIVTGDYLYFLGDRGGAVTNQCNQDELYPFSLRIIKDFEGIAHRDHANVATDKSSKYYVNSRAGMGEIAEDVFGFAMDELDHELNRDMAVYFKIIHCGNTLYEEPCSPCEGEMLETSCIKHSVLEEFSSDESQTDLDDYESEDTNSWDAPLFFEQSGSESSHYKVTTTTRYVIISHNSGKEIGDCEESCICYNRMYLYDRRLLSGSMLHINHVDVRVIEDDFYIISDGLLKRMVLKYDPLMPSFLYYKGLEMHTDKWTQLTEMNLAGVFNGEPDEGFIEPIFTVFTEESGHHYHDAMSKYHRSQYTRKYGGIIRGKMLDFVVPFAGYLSSIKLSYHK